MKKIGKTGLRKGIEKALQEHKGKPLEHRLVIPPASDYLLAKLKLPTEALTKAKQLEAHSLRLLEATTAVQQGVPITIKSARTIIQNTKEQIPVFLERNQKKLTPQQIRDLDTLKLNLARDLQKLQGVPEKLPTTFSPQFLETAKEIHLAVLRELLGNKFGLYTRAMGRTTKVLARKK